MDQSQEEGDPGDPTQDGKALAVALPERTKRDLSSGTLFYNQLDVVEPMDPEEETELCRRQEQSRFMMLESVLAIPLGRKMFFDPLRQLIAGEVVLDHVLDPVVWGIGNRGMLQSRQGEMKDLLDGMNRTYQDREIVRRLHIRWVRLESLGRKLFDGLERCKGLIARRRELLAMLDRDVTLTRMTAIDRESAILEDESPMIPSWLAYPELVSIRTELDLLEIRTGKGIFEFATAAGRFKEALKAQSAILERFVEANLKLVLSRVRGYYTGNAMDEMDLVQEGCQGLMQAVRRFDYARGFRFSTYAVWWIKQAILKAILRQARLIRLPAGVLSKSSRIREVMDMLAQENGEMPTPEELSTRLEMTSEEVESILTFTSATLSLDHTTGEQDSTIADFLAGRFGSPDRQVLGRDLHQRVRTALKDLSDRDKTILTLRFGLFDGNPCTLNEIGRIYGISRERVRQIEARAIRRLREHGLLSPGWEDGE